MCLFLQMKGILLILPSFPVAALVSSVLFSVNPLPFTQSHDQTLFLLLNTTQGWHHLISPKQIKALDFSAINKYLMKALCHGLSSSETMYSGIDTGKAAKCQQSSVLYWFSDQLQYKSVSDNVGYLKPCINSQSKKNMLGFFKSLEYVVCHKK